MVSSTQHKRPPTHILRAKDMIVANQLRKRELANKLTDFCSKTLSTSTAIQNTSADRGVGHTVLPLSTILDMGGVPLAPPLNAVEWLNFKNLITKPLLNNTLSESAGIHPTVRQIFFACNAISHDPYKLYFEKKFADLDNMAKKPDISIVMLVSVGTKIEEIVVPIEIKKFEKLSDAIHQALGYLVSKLRNLLDIHGFDVVLSGFCLGTDGLSLAVGFVRIENFNIFMTSTGEDSIPLWGLSPPTTETMGIQVIRSLMLRTPQELGHANLPIPERIVGDRYFDITGVIGRGAFCTAFTCAARVGLHGAQEDIVVKEESNVAIHTHHVPLDRLMAECEILRAFTEQDPQSDHLPRLWDAAWTVTPHHSFIPLLPVGQPLEIRVAMVEDEDLEEEARTLHENVLEALVAAHHAGFCHRDMRPGNIVYNELDGTYVLIDWGLAAAPNTPLHPYQGGKPYWHDEIIFAKNLMQNINYVEEHDRAAVRYIAWAFQFGKKMIVPWHKKAADLIPARNALVGNYLQGPAV